MFALTYRPATTGGGIVVATGGGFVVLEQSAAALVGAVRDALNGAHGSGSVEAIIGVLTSDGFARTPSFALVEVTGDDVRVIVRGGLDLEVSDANGSHSVSGSGISTWNERGFTTVTSATVTVADAEPVADLPDLVLDAGDVYAASVSLMAHRSAAADEAIVPTANESTASISEATVASIPDDAHAGVAEGSLSEDGGDTVLRPRTVSAPVTAPQGTAPEQVAPEQAVPEEAVPEEAAPRAAVPDDAVPEEAAPEQAVPDDAAAASAPSHDRLGDHDGSTVLNSDLPRRRAQKPEATPPAPVIAVPQLHLSSGTTEPLDRPILVGRAPSVSKVSGGLLPRLVTVGTADHDISRNHAQFTLEGGTVVVTDLHSRNGTLVVLPGKGPQKLRAGEPTAVIVGTVVDFGGGVTMTVREG